MLEPMAGTVLLKCAWVVNSCKEWVGVCNEVEGECREWCVSALVGGREKADCPEG